MGPARAIRAGLAPGPPAPGGFLGKFVGLPLVATRGYVLPAVVARGAPPLPACIPIQGASSLLSEAYVRFWVRGLGSRVWRTEEEEEVLDLGSGVWRTEEEEEVFGLGSGVWRTEEDGGGGVSCMRTYVHA